MEEKVVIVTGGTHGIGRACVETLSTAGYRVVFTGRDLDAGNAIVQQLPSALFIQGDVADPLSIENVVNQSLQLGGGKLGGLVNNAGITLRKPFHRTRLDDWETIMKINVRSAYLFTRYSIEGLCAARGSVVMMSSVAGKGGEEELSLYCASKAAIIGLAKALALELGNRIRVNTLCPGQIATRMMDRILEDPIRKDKIKRSIPAGRLGEAKDIADAVLWLISEASGFVNGAVIPVDGGETAGIYKSKY